MWIIYHNHRCSKSRGALKLLESRGIEPEVINYLEKIPTKSELRVLLEKLDRGIDEVVRKKEEAFIPFKQEWDRYSLEEKLDIIVAHPILLERPIVVHGDKARLGRPTEAAILELLEEE